MRNYLVIYAPDPRRADLELFPCQAEDGDHAEEQCVNAYPFAYVVWVAETGDEAEAWADYYDAREATDA